MGPDTDIFHDPFEVKLAVQLIGKLEDRRALVFMGGAEVQRSLMKNQRRIRRCTFTQSLICGQVGVGIK